MCCRVCCRHRHKHECVLYWSIIVPSTRPCASGHGRIDHQTLSKLWKLTKNTSTSLDDDSSILTSSKCTLFLVRRLQINFKSATLACLTRFCDIGLNWFRDIEPPIPYKGSFDIRPTIHCKNIKNFKYI